MENEGGLIVQPFYLVCDESASMTDDQIAAINRSIGELFRTIHSDPFVDERSRLGIIAFNDQARVLLPLTQLSLVTHSPGCVAGGSTSYASVFHLLKSEIKIDVPRLKSEGFRVRRPTVLFVSGSIPLDPGEWRDAHGDLADDNFGFHPNIICLGLQGSHPGLLTQIATKSSIDVTNDDGLVFLAEDVQDVDAIGIFFRRFLLSIFDFGSLGEINGISQFFTSRTFSQENSITRSGSDLSNAGGLLPLYIACDEGSFMTNEGIAAVNEGIRELFRAILSDPYADAKIRVGIITFNDQANVLLPLTVLSRISQALGCVRSDKSSSFKSVFRLLKVQIENDVWGLEAEGFRVHRPVVLFMSCGKPKLEDWYSSWEELTEKKSRFRPHIVSWGTSGADFSIVMKVATYWPFGTNSNAVFAFIAQDGVRPGDVLHEIMELTVSDMAPLSPPASFFMDTGSLGEPTVESI